MQAETLDCRGLACPQPVVETKKKLATISAGSLEVMVDNETAKSNVLKLAASLGMETVVRENDGIFTLTLLKQEISTSIEAQSKSKTLLITSDTLGRGSDELGSILIKSFFYALAESNRLPQAIYFVNSGVKLACVGSPALESLERLHALGVELYSCGICLDYFELKEKLLAGQVTNMYAIVESLFSSDVIQL